MKTMYTFVLSFAVATVAFMQNQPYIADNIYGKWQYRISDVPPEYESGYFTFEQKENKPVGYVEAGEKQVMEALTIEQDKVSFTTESQAGVFKYSFALKGDTLTGVVASQYGDFPIRAVKQSK